MPAQKLYVYYMYINSRIELALRIIKPGKNWNINETFGFNIIEVSINTQKKLADVKNREGLYFQTHFQDGRHRPYWKINF